MVKYELLNFEVGGKIIPVRRFVERRRNVRISVGKSSVIFRIPISMGVDERNKYHIWARDWILKRIKKYPESFNHLLPIEYKTGSVVRCMDRDYNIELVSLRKSSSSAKIIGRVIKISLNNSLSDLDRSDTIKTLLSRVLAKVHKEEVVKRLSLINKFHFGHTVKSVRLKYNRTNWGSCSSSGNINLSTRLLMAPEWVRDYVIVHELAHMNEMNHSKKYWDIVKKVYPEYKKAEKWLKLYGGNCDFVPLVAD